jgi:hypothetical protein
MRPDPSGRIINYGPRVGTVYPQACVRVDEYAAHFKDGAWRWRKTRTMVTEKSRRAIDQNHPAYANTPRGGIRNRPVQWPEIRLMTLPWAWISPTIDGMIARLDAGDHGAAGILADALQDGGFPESCPVLTILRSWTATPIPAEQPS